ncbi:hypothetical protein IWZ01DRAFT_526984 [Phyllosticta capitalensis]
MADKDKGQASRLPKSPTIKQLFNAGSSKTLKKVNKSIHGLRNVFQKDASSEPMPPATKPVDPVYQLPSGPLTWSSSLEPLLPGRDRSASSTAMYASSQAETNQTDEGEAVKGVGEANVGEFFERFQEALQLAREKDIDKCHDKCRKLLQMRISDGLRYEVLTLMTTILPSREAMACVEELKTLCKFMENNAENMRRRILEQGATWDG